MATYRLHGDSRSAGVQSTANHAAAAAVAAVGASGSATVTAAWRSTADGAATTAIRIRTAQSVLEHEHEAVHRQVVRVARAVASPARRPRSREASEVGVRSGGRLADVRVPHHSAATPCSATARVRKMPMCGALRLAIVV